MACIKVAFDAFTEKQHHSATWVVTPKGISSMFTYLYKCNDCGFHAGARRERWGITNRILGTEYPHVALPQSAKPAGPSLAQKTKSIRRLSRGVCLFLPSESITQTRSRVSG